MASLLEVRNISKHFGGVKAVDGLSFDIPQGGLQAIIGPNGSGKTTCINLITGCYHLTGGAVSFSARSNSVIFENHAFIRVLSCTNGTMYFLFLPGLDF